MDAHALETPEARHPQPAVAGPSRGDYAARRDLAALGELNAVEAVLPPPQAYSLLGNSSSGTELVGLDQDAAGEFEAGETNGEARVVLYPGASARLSPQRHRLECERSEALRSPVNRGAEARRPCTDHGEVVGFSPRSVHLEACGARKLGV